MIFQYYFPGTVPAHVTPELIKRKGLGDVFRDCTRTAIDWSKSIAIRQVYGGPDNREGTIVGMLPEENPDQYGKIGYFPKDQQWKPVGKDPKKQDYWLGWITENPPNPGSLRRKEIVTGYDYELGDQNFWHCPRIGWPELELMNCNLPQTLECDPQGKWFYDIKAEYRDAWELAREIFRLKLGFTQLEISRHMDAAAYFLGLNYRLGKHEISALQLFDDRNFVRVLDAAIDAGAMMECLKEIDPDFKGEELSAAEKKKKVNESLNTTSVTPPG